MVAEAGVQVRQATSFRRVSAEFEDAFAEAFGGRECRVVRGGQESRFDFGDKLAIKLGGFLGSFPFRVGAEGLPGGVAGSLVGVGKEVDQLVIGVLRGHEVTEVGHAMFFEQFDRVVAEAGVEGLKLAFSGVVDAHLEETGVGLVGGTGGSREQTESEEGEERFHVI